MVRMTGQSPPGPDDPVYRAVIAARAPDALQRHVHRAWQEHGKKTRDGFRVTIPQTHYKPFTRARLLAEVMIPRKNRTKPPRRQILFVQIYNSAKAARRGAKAARKKHFLNCRGPASLLIEEWNAVVWALPNGPCLRTANIAFRRKKFKRFLADHGLIPRSVKLPKREALPQILRYVPHKRALFRYEIPIEDARRVIYIKMYASDLDAPAARNLSIVSAAASREGVSFHSPGLLAHCPWRQAVIMEALPGTPLSQLAGGGDRAVLARVGCALADLHASAIRPAATWSSKSEIRALAAAMSDVTNALPALSTEIAGLIADLAQARARLTFEESAPIHGNLFGDQILVDSQQIGIVDWDDLTLGDPMYDVGRLIAHLIFLAHQQESGPTTLDGRLEALLDAYARTSGKRIPRARLNWHIAVALLLRAKISALRPLSAHWIDEIEMSIRLARRALAIDGSADTMVESTGPGMLGRSSTLSSG